MKNHIGLVNEFAVSIHHVVGSVRIRLTAFIFGEGIGTWLTAALRPAKVVW
jgi:hypothetical protein